MHVGDAGDPDVVLGLAKSEGGGNRGFAFENQAEAVFDACLPLRGTGGAAAQDVDAGECRGRGTESNRAEDLRPRSRILRGNVVGGRRRCQERRNEHEASEKSHTRVLCGGRRNSAGAGCTH